MSTVSNSHGASISSQSCCSVLKGQPSFAPSHASQGCLRAPYALSDTCLSHNRFLGEEAEELKTLQEEHEAEARLKREQQTERDRMVSTHTFTSCPHMAVCLGTVPKTACVLISDKPHFLMSVQDRITSRSGCGNFECCRLCPKLLLWAAALFCTTWPLSACVQTEAIRPL